MAARVRKGARYEAGHGVRLVPGLEVRAGQTIAGKYRVETLVGSGASGIVLSARNIHLRERVALKIFASYTDGQEALLRRRVEKARLAAGLRGAHVARIVEIGVTADAMPFVATEWLEGTTLEAELAERERLSLDEAARWVLEACEGLAEAHANGLVHGDLKPQNILLAEPKKATRKRPLPESDAPAPEVDARVLKILDFGTTSPLDAIGDQSASAFFGSPAFLAPEQIQSPDAVDARADVWALGVLLYNAISGSLPFEADTVSGMLVAVVHDAPALLTDAPYGLARLVHHCLDKDPAKRPQNVAELAAELAPFAGENGPRLAERVRAILDATPEAPPGSTDASATGSMPPVSLPVPTPRTEATHPSKLVIAQRRSRDRATALKLVGAAGALAVASWATTHPWALPAFFVGHHGPAESAIEAPGAAPPRAPEEAADATRAPNTNAAPPLAVPERSLSFAPTSSATVTPTPLAVTPTPLATAAPVPVPAPVASPAAPPFVLPAPAAAPKAWRNPTPYRLPAGLPRSRDAVPVPAPLRPDPRAERK